MANSDDLSARQEPLRSAGPKPKARRTRATDIIVSIVLPWLIFFLVISLFLFAYHDMRVLVWMLIILCFGLALLFLILGRAARHGTFLAIGFLCMVSVLAGVTVGLWIKNEYLHRYWQLDDGQVYENISPISNSAATADASIIHFRNGTFVDDMRTVGFVAQGSIYCVAPFGIPGPYTSRVEYWAVGINCCEKRMNFECGTAREPGNLSAVVEVPSRQFKAAIQQAQSIYGVTSADSMQLLNVMGNPNDFVDEMWDEAMSIALIAMILDLLICALAGMVIAKVLIPIPSNAAGPQASGSSS